MVIVRMKFGNIVQHSALCLPCGRLIGARRRRDATIIDVRWECFYFILRVLGEDQSSWEDYWSSLGKSCWHKQDMGTDRLSFSAFTYEEKVCIEV